MQWLANLKLARIASRARLVGVVALASCLCWPAYGGVIASSQADFSGSQGQGNWTYGFFSQGADPGAAFDTAGVTLFDTFTGSSWRASGTLIPDAADRTFLNLNADGGHPTGIGPGSQDEIIWAVRRYTSAISDVLQIDFDLRKQNIVNPQGGGITGKIFVDGTMVLDQFIANADGTGLQGSLFVNANVGTVIDFAISPTGLSPGADSDHSARADGSVFAATISVPAPMSAALLVIGMVAVMVNSRGR